MSHWNSTKIALCLLAPEYEWTSLQMGVIANCMYITWVKTNLSWWWLLLGRGRTQHITHLFKRNALAIHTAWIIPQTFVQDPVPVDSFDLSTEKLHVPSPSTPKWQWHEDSDCQETQPMTPTAMTSSLWPTETTFNSNFWPSWYPRDKGEVFGDTNVFKSTPGLGFLHFFDSGGTKKQLYNSYIIASMLIQINLNKQI